MSFRATILIRSVKINKINYYAAKQAPIKKGNGITIAFKVC